MITKKIKLTRNEYMALRDLGYSSKEKPGLPYMYLNNGGTTYGNGGYGTNVIKEDYSAELNAMEDLSAVTNYTKKHLLEQAKMLKEIADKL